MNRLISPRRIAPGVLLLALFLAACGGRRPFRPAGVAPDATMGVYRVTLEHDGESRRFRMLLFADRPDRLHAEALSPIGRTELIVDGGGGRLAVSVPRERRAYVGDAGPERLEPLIGIPLSLEELVSALLDPGAPLVPGVLREPEGRPGLPSRLELTGEGGARVEFRLIERRPLRTSTEQLGTGTAAPGLEVWPLDDLGAVAWPDDAPAGGAEPGR